MQIYLICDYYRHKTDLADLSSFKKNWEISAANFEISFDFKSGNLQLEQPKFPVFWQNFQIPCVFPDREFLWPFSLFSLCSGYPEQDGMYRSRKRAITKINLIFKLQERARFNFYCNIFYRDGQNTITYLELGCPLGN